VVLDDVVEGNTCAVAACHLTGASTGPQGHDMSKTPPQRAKKCKVRNNNGLSLHWTHVGGESGCTINGSDRHGRNSHAIWREALLVANPPAHRARLMWEWELTKEHLGIFSTRLPGVRKSTKVSNVATTHPYTCNPPVARTPSARQSGMIDRSSLASRGHACKATPALVMPRVCA